jgi:hypothetical protein
MKMVARAIKTPQISYFRQSRTGEVASVSLCKLLPVIANGRRTRPNQIALWEARRLGLGRGRAHPYFLPARFCAITSPLGVGRNTTDTNPSSSIRLAASRTVLRC